MSNLPCGYHYHPEVRCRCCKKIKEKKKRVQTLNCKNIETIDSITKIRKAPRPNTWLPIKKPVQFLGRHRELFDLWPSLFFPCKKEGQERQKREILLLPSDQGYLQRAENSPTQKETTYRHFISQQKLQFSQTSFYYVESCVRLSIHAEGMDKRDPTSHIHTILAHIHTHR